MRTELLRADEPAHLQRAVAAAVAALASGQPVALPTETVYGLAADALSPQAAARIFEAKERPFFDPLICHLPSLAWLERMALLPREAEALVAQLTARFWPGPLTLVLPKRPEVPDIVTAGLPTVALRQSAHTVFQAVVTAFGRPLAAPSANRFGRISPTTGQHVMAELEGRIPLVVDGGPAMHGVESTIVMVVGRELRLLRPGPISAEMLSEFAPVLPALESERPEAPGQLKSHYAPTTPLWLVPQVKPEMGEPTIGVLAWRELKHPERFGAAEVLSASGDFREAAATLFAKMRRLDEGGWKSLLAEEVPMEGLGVAIMDRLRKAQQT